jgi:membrane protein required for colicin V production
VPIELQAVDWIAGAILGAAMLRGVFLGLIRQVVSIAALVAACLVVRRFTTDVAAWLGQTWQGSIDPQLAPWLAGATLAIGTLVAGGVLGRLLRRGARIAWLGLPDRIGGAMLGAAQGVLVCAILLLAATSLIGREHPLVEGSRSIAALEQLEHLAAGVTSSGVDVAAPPPARRP